MEETSPNPCYKVTITPNKIINIMTKTTWPVDLGEQERENHKKASRASELGQAGLMWGKWD